MAYDFPELHHAAVDSDKDRQADTWTIQKIVNWSTRFLGEKTPDPQYASPRLDAEVLLCHVLGCNRTRLYMDFDKPVTVGERETYKGYLRRRIAGEPTAYIVGKREFMGLEFQVSPAVLIPRPDSEILVEQVISDFRQRTHTEQLSLMDIGTGSGCLALSIAKFTKFQVLAADVSETALTQARENCSRLGLAAVNFLRFDALANDGWIAELERAGSAQKSFDVIVSNPPYIALTERETLPLSVRGHEPGLALFGGDDGLLFYRKIAAEARNLIKDGGTLYLEIGASQATAVSAALAANGWQGLKVIKDLGGLDRVVRAQWYANNLQQPLERLRS